VNSFFSFEEGFSPTEKKNLANWKTLGGPRALINGSWIYHPQSPAQLQRKGDFQLTKHSAAIPCCQRAPAT